MDNKAMVTKENIPWYQHAVIYQIYPWSFKDSDSDGVGDLEGIISKLDYLAGTPDSLGVTAIWLTPIFPSPMKDFGYDVSDYRNIDPHFGSLETFKRLVTEAHKRNIKIIIDLVTNHTSSEHPWFIESQKSKDNPKRDWYVWKDPNPKGGPPNNWLSVPGDSAWTLDTKTGQYYLHQFLAAQPDLNWRNPLVREEFKHTMEFWIGLGVDGFRVDAISHMVEDEKFQNEPVSTLPRKKRTGYNTLSHIYSKDQPELGEIVALFSEIAHEHKDIFIVSETYGSLDTIISLYKGAERYHNQVPFNLGLIDLPWDPQAYRAIIDVYERAVNAIDPSRVKPYVLGNHDQSRLASRIGTENTRVAAMLLLTLPGSPFIYYGEELGITDVPIPITKAKDGFAFVSSSGQPINRDGVRTPMQWSSEPYAGFSTVKPWLPISDQAEHINVASEQKDPHSLFNLYKKLIQLRKNSVALQDGHYKSQATRSPDIFAYTRIHREETLLMMLNFSNRTIEESAPPSGSMIIQSTYMDITSREVVDRTLTIRPNEGIVLRVKT